MNQTRLDNPKLYSLNAKAIETLRAHFRDQPSLEQIARHFHLSPSHFQRLFRRWVGLTPKQFLQHLTVTGANALLRQDYSCLDASYSLGLSSASRLHDHLVTLEAVTPGELKTHGKGMTFYTGEANTPFGLARVNWTERGIHTLRFMQTAASRETADQSKTRSLWQQASWQTDHPSAQALLDRVFSNGTIPERFSLWVQGTNFQVAVWRALLNIPEGKLESYGGLALAINKQNASRAVGSAVGSNPTALLIPCHRVIRNDGNLGGYRWGLETKSWLLGKELAASEGETDKTATKSRGA